MIHSLFHLDSPSVTVVVRTPSSAVHAPQLTYERSGLAYDPFFDVPRTQKISQLLRVLWTSNHPQRVAVSESAILTVDAYSAVRIIVSLSSRAVLEGQSALIELLRARDPELAALLRETACRLQGERFLVGLRKRTQSPRHRMLLALLLNLPDRASIISVLRQIASRESPEEWICETVRSMYVTPGERSDGKNVLGMPLDGANGEVILQMLLNGRSVEDVTRVAADSNCSPESIRAVCLTMLRSPVLAPLLRHP